MFYVFSEKDKVILDLGKRGNSFLIDCDTSLSIAHALELHALDAEKEPKSLLAGEVWDVRIQSFDGEVGFYFTPPHQHVGHPTRVPMPPSAARSIARLIRHEASFAQHKLRLVVQGA